MSAAKDYLGDSVYVDLTEYGEVILTTENGYGPNNTIVMDAQVLKAFQSWLVRVREGGKS